MVVSNRENVEFSAVVESIKHHDAVVIQRQISQIDQGLQALNALDPIEAQIQPF